MFPPPAGQSCASAQIWPAVTRERGRQTDVEKKAWGSKGQGPSRFFPPFLGGKKWGAMRPELKRENQSSAAGRHGSKLCPGFRQHTGGPLMWVPLQKNSPPDCFSFPSCILGRKRLRFRGSAPKTPQAFYKRLDRKFQVAPPCSYFPTQKRENTSSTTASVTFSPVNSSSDATAPSSETVTASSVMPIFNARSASSNDSFARLAASL